MGPEEIEFRHPNRITNLLNGVNGVSFHRNATGDQIAMGYSGQCKMTVLVDGLTQCPGMGCRCPGCGPYAPGDKLSGSYDDLHAVLIDRVLEANDVAAIEVYPRGGNMPVGLQVADPACGVIAFWTGSRKP